MAFKIMFGAVLVYVLLGSYSYFCNNLPALDKSMAITRSGMLRGIDRYLRLLDKEAKRPWFTPYLRHFRAITVVYLIVFVVIMALVSGES